MALWLPEYLAKELLAGYGLAIPRGVVVRSGDDVWSVLEKSGLRPPLVVKAQVRVLCRSRYGGVRVADSLEDAARLARDMLGSRLAGIPVDSVLVEEYVDHDEEAYAAVTVDRAMRRPVVLVSRRGLGGGGEDRVERVYVDPFVGLRLYEARMLGQRIGLRGRRLLEFARTVKTLYDVFWGLDAVLVEANPVGFSGDNTVVLDAHVVLDRNALWRHPELGKLVERIVSGLEYQAWSMGIAFTELDGNVAVIGNGAGLTMATMDLVYRYGGRPACFLDVGGGARREKVKAALELVSSLPGTRSIVVNVYGGITRCEEVAWGIIDALRAGLRLPVFVRLAGAGEEEARRVLASYGVRVYSDPREAVRDAVRAATSVARS